jgi:hypothetical protein
MVAGISGAALGSGATAGDDEKDGRLMLLQAPRNIVSAEAIPRLATVRALRDLTMASPKQFPAAPIRSQAQNSCRSNDVQQITPELRFSFRKHPISASPRA